MEPSRAPWMTSDSAGAVPFVQGMLPPAPASHLTGVPVQHVVHANPHMPIPVDFEAARLRRDWQPARKWITTQRDLQRFLAYDSAQDFVGFILALNEAMKGRKLSDACHVSSAVSSLLAFLQRLDSLVDATPPSAHTLRYGNPAYRVWFAGMTEAVEGFLLDLLPEALSGAATELAPYVIDSFGNQTRIDYGTGHETTFVALLYCLARLGVFNDGDQTALVSRVFNTYILLMRKIQTTYWLEPAGSHGVWGLDDYHFLPFIWGSAQLVGHPIFRPKAIHNPDALESYGDEYLYLGAVRFVRQVKKGPLGETSPMLNDISGVPNWAKVNSGMMKMYQVELLSKLPIMQHFLFGSLLPFPPDDFMP